MLRNLVVVSAALLAAPLYAAEPPRAAQAANLVKCYHEACARGNESLARELAKEAVTLDPTCFATKPPEPQAESRAKRWLRERFTGSDPNLQTESLIHQSEDLRQVRAEWRRIWFTDQPSHLTPDRVHGGIK